MVNWYEILSAPVTAVQDGVDEASELFASSHTGPRTFDRIDYPVSEIMPDETNRLDTTNWGHSIVVNLYFERSREQDYLEDIIYPSAVVIDHVLSSLGNLECVTNYYPESISDFAGELDGTQLILVSITFRCQTMVDPGEFD